MELTDIAAGICWLLLIGFFAREALKLPR